MTNNGCPSLMTEGYNQPPYVSYKCYNEQSDYSTYVSGLTEIQFRLLVKRNVINTSSYYNNMN